jgi:ABC-type tungstate transport system substrate-binding protein
LDKFAGLSAALASAELWQIIALSLTVSLSATAAAAILACRSGWRWRSGIFRAGIS